MKALNIDPRKADLLFSGKTVTIKKKADGATAKKYKNVFRQAGAVCHITPYTEAKKSNQSTIECPKCHKKQPPSDSCMYCGIVFRKFREIEEQTETPKDESPLQAEDRTPNGSLDTTGEHPDSEDDNREVKTSFSSNIEMTMAVIMAGVGCLVGLILIAENLSENLQIGAFSTIVILLCAFMILMFALLRLFKLFILSAIIGGTVVSVVSKGQMDLSALGGFIFGLSISVLIWSIVGAISGYIIGFFVKGFLDTANDYAQARKNPMAGPARINLSALLQPRSLLALASLGGVLVLGYIAYDAWNAHRDYLSVNKPAMESASARFVKARADLHLSYTLAGSVHFPELAKGKCSFRSSGQFLRELKESPEDVSYDDIVACTAKYHTLNIIKPFFEWYDLYCEENDYLFTRTMEDIIVMMKNESIHDIKSIFHHSDNPKALEMCTRILTYIGSKEAMTILADSLISRSEPSCYASANAIEAVVVSDFIEKEMAFEAIKSAFCLEDPKLRLKAIQALRFFRGNGPIRLLEEGEKDPDQKVRRASKDLITKYKSDPR